MRTIYTPEFRCATCGYVIRMLEHYLEVTIEHRADGSHRMTFTPENYARIAGAQTPMKIIATLTPQDVRSDPYQVRCLVPTCWRAETPGVCPDLPGAQALAETHVREQRHTVVIEVEETEVRRA